ncbi:MAG TPA: YqiA/YcfP family alpha/beta fold hydrolase [Anaeromyxobacteraceae bacterium]|nr:YqiA/YcfP family alpha/beta fold hydrolase [Anaeromyxobacteraceae bacterium]
MILYLHGFASGPNSHKATAFRDRFRELGVEVHCPDLTPGPDGFELSTPSSMLAIAEAALGARTGPHALIGSSLGGYLAALAAARNPSVARLFLLAPAFRLYERWSARLGRSELERWRARGSREVFHHASNRERRIGWAFFEDAARLPPFPAVTVPSLAIAGVRDEMVALADVEAFVERTPGARLLKVDDAHELAQSIDLSFREAREFLRPLTGA